MFVVTCLRAGGDKNKVNLMRLTELQRELFTVFVHKQMSAKEMAALGAESDDSDATSDSEFELVEDEEDEEDDDYAYFEEKNTRAR